MKRIVSFILASAVLCQLLVLNVSAATDDNVIYSEDFSSGELDSQWTTRYKKNDKVFASVSADDNNLKMIYTSKGSTAGLYATRKIEGLGVDAAEVSFDFISGGTTVNLAQNIILNSGKESFSTALEGKNIATTSDSIHLVLYNSKFYYLDGNDNTFKILPSADFKPDTVYYYKAVINNTKSTYSLYLSDSELTADTLPVLQDMPIAFSTKTAPDTLHFQFHKYASDNHSALVIDNIRASVISDSIYKKLDFENELKDIAPYVEKGDFETVDSMILEHFREKSSPVSDEVSGKSSVAACELYKKLYIYDNVSHLGDITFSNKYTTLSLFLTNTVKAADKYTFELIADNVNSPEIEIYSKEQGGNNIALTVTADGKTFTFYPTDDTYISYENKNTSYGNDDRMYIAERPGDSSVFGNGTKRAYMMFDLTSLQGKTITNAVLTLRGRTPPGSASANAGVWLLSDNTWDENTLCWNNIIQQVLCFNGLDAIPFDKLTADNLNNDRIGVVETWERMYWMTTLTNAFRRNGTEEYAKVAIDILMSFIDHQFKTGFAGNSGLSTAIRARELSKCHHHLSKSSHMTPEKNIRYLEYMYELGKFLEDDANFRVNHNWGTFQILGLNHTASYFTEFVRSPLWKNLAIKRTGMLLENVLAKDGSYVEGSTHYAYEAIRQIMKTVNAIEASGNPLSDEAKENLTRLCKYALDTSFPNGYDISYGDGGYGKTDIDVAINYLNDSNLNYINSRGTTGTKPDYTSVLYPDGRNKMAIMRSGFCEDDLAMYINNGAANRLSHTHPDDLAVIAYAYGNPLLIDPGSYSYDVTEPSEWQRHTTEAHNTVTIDSSAQAHSDGTVSGWSTTSALDYYEGVSTAYSGFEHNRKVYFIKDKLWLVSDSITSGDSNIHSYDQNWHFETDAAPAISTDGKKAVTTAEGKANITVLQLDEGNSVLLKKGWYTDTAGKLTDASFASFTKKKAGGASFLTLLYPHKTGETADVSAKQLATSSSCAKAYEISDGKTKDIIILNEQADKTVAVGDISFTGEFVYIRGNGQKISALNMKSLYINNKPVIVSDTAIGNLSLTLDGDIMKIDTDSTKLLENADVYSSKSPEKLIYNGIETDFSHISGRLIPGKVFSWNINGETNASLKPGKLAVSAIGDITNNLTLATSLFNDDGTLLSVKLGSFKDGRYQAEITVDDKADKALLMLYDADTIAPATKSVIIE